jgi:hypothetical protein
MISAMSMYDREFLSGMLCSSSAMWSLALAALRIAIALVIDTNGMRSGYFVMDVWIIDAVMWMSPRLRLKLG